MKYDCKLAMQDNNYKDCETFRISLTGLTGGHSGLNVCRPHINAITFLAQCVLDFAHLNNIEIPISAFNGGPINNSLPIFASIDVVMKQKDFDKLKRFIIAQLTIAKNVAQKQEDHATASFNKISNPKRIYSPENSTKILLFASLAPNKVFTQTLGENKMFSSSNLGFVSIDDGHVKFDFKVRSFIDGEIQRVVRKISSLGRLFGFNDYIQQGQLFSFINDLKDNHVAQIWGECYKKVTGKTIKCLTVAGGLECALVCVKNPVMVANTISINTTLFNCHPPAEGFSVQDTIQF
ncbi:MAG: hypothetical protein MJ223_00470 [Mycoplasmoidaceae bacterium]|nr:hypothetical protein [Mycoplasmoidaceae bacterium]